MKTMLKKIISCLVLFAALVPSISLAQVFSQNQVIIQPYSGFLYSSSTSATAKLGATTTPWFLSGFGFSNATGTQARLGDGSNVLPALSFSADPDTGIYRPSTNQISLAGGGTSITWDGGLTVFRPNSDNISSLGSAALRWKNLWLGGTATSTALVATELGTAAGTFLAADPTGRLIATTTPMGGSASSTLLTDDNYFAGANTFLNIPNSTSTNAYSVHFYAGNGTRPTFNTDIYTASTRTDPTGSTAPLFASSTVNAVSGAYTSALIGVSSNIHVGSGNTQNWTAGAGMSGGLYSVLTDVGGIGTVSNAFGLGAGVGNGGGETITNAYGLASTGVQNSGIGSITNGAGIVVPAITAATNNTHLLIGTLTIPTGNFGIYNSSTNNNYFAGNVGVKTASPNFDLEVNGTASTTSLYATNSTSTNATTTELNTATFTLTGATTGCATFTGTALSSTGVACGSGSGSSYPFPLTGNATSTLTQFNGGLTAFASSTISALTATNATSTHATTTDFTISGLATPAGTFAAIDPTGKVIATTTPSGGGGSPGGSGTELQYRSGASTFGAVSSGYTAGGNFLGIGTTTPQWLLDLSTTTRPQLDLDGGAGINGWAMRSVGNNFYLASSSPTTYATGTPAIAIVSGISTAGPAIGFGGVPTDAYDFFNGTTALLKLPTSVSGNPAAFSSGGTFNGNISMDGGSFFLFSSRAALGAVNDPTGVINLQSSGAGTTFNRLDFGTAVSTNPSLRVNGTGLQFRLADNSTDASTSASTLTLVPQATPTSPAEGTLWDDSSQKTLSFQLDGVRQNSINSIFSATATSSVSNTTASTSVISASGIGTQTLPTNFFVPGKVIEVSGGGVYSATGITPSLNICVLVGGTAAACGNANTLITTGSGMSFDFNVRITCLSIASNVCTATISGGGTYSISGVAAAPNSIDLANGGNGFTFASNASQKIDVVAKWSAAATGNILTTLNTVIRTIN